MHAKCYCSQEFWYMEHGMKKNVTLFDRKYAYCQSVDILSKTLIGIKGWLSLNTGGKQWHFFINIELDRIEE